jgi:hypothetical protein
MRLRNYCHISQQKSAANFLGSFKFDESVCVMEFKPTDAYKFGPHRGGTQMQKPSAMKNEDVMY